MPAPPKGGAFLWWRYSFRLKYKVACLGVTPSVIACGDATLPLLSRSDKKGNLLSEAKLRG